MTDEKLIEEMSKAEFASICRRQGKTIKWDDISDDVKSEWFEDTKAILSLIRSHYDLVEKGKVHEYAKVCCDCEGCGTFWNFLTMNREQCHQCSGHGIVKI